MTFEGQYLTYNEYLQLGGTAIGETPFNLLEFEARKQIDLRTQQRLVEVENIPQEVKLCMFNLINKIQNYANTIAESSGNKVNETTDGYSVTYINATQIKEVVNNKNAELEDIIMQDLFGVIVNNEHLIYNGVA